MANEQYAFLSKSNLPTVDTWQSALDDSPFDLKLDPTMQIGGDVGFTPYTLCGAELGVETYYDDSPDFMSQFQQIAPGKDYCISFRWGGSEIECAIAMILCYALAKDFDAVISYEGDAPYSSLDTLRDDAQGTLEDSGILG